MFVIGLTGAIGTGKSEAAATLAALGATVLDADREGHTAYAAGTEGWRKVVDLVGNEVVAADGTIDRRVLTERIFKDRELRTKLNALLHPLIRRRIEGRLLALERANKDTVVVEVALLFQAGWQDLVDETWAMSASRQTTVDRLMQHRGLERDQADRRIDAQGPPEAFTGPADVVIENEGSLNQLHARVQELWTEVHQLRG